ncbi:hypothetical protein Trydic_g20663 [Trypoxylus dichotomus]
MYESLVRNKGLDLETTAVRIKRWEDEIKLNGFCSILNTVIKEHRRILKPLRGQAVLNEASAAFGHQVQSTVLHSPWQTTIRFQK